ncbi:12031_t:CDS:2 [Funneliformis mosseae]|uniref:12031_t:CDS:1 n=1 Tax=Funneliformis mosseae TaxID=27381 RepID=A0A9N9AI80_FUNMO|nr:12031_t:CDS:2 [Funneliformis mosseae]
MSEKSDLQELSANASLPSLPNVFLSFQPQPSSLHNTYEEIADISPYCPPNLKPPHYQQGGDQYWRGDSMGVDKSREVDGTIIIIETHQW